MPILYLKHNHIVCLAEILQVLESQTESHKVHYSSFNRQPKQLSSSYILKLQQMIRIMIFNYVHTSALQIILWGFFI